MKVNFSDLPEHAKVWMYQAERKLSPTEQALIQRVAEQFLSEWESHGLPVQGAVDVLQEMTIRVAAFTDEDAMCGRAQDAQVRLMKMLEAELGVQLTNRMVLAFGEEGAEQFVHMSALPSHIQAAEIHPQSIFYDNLVLSKADFERAWKTEAGSSWVARYF
jgi:hypothetical protein